jgi:hypothetical protein
MNRYTPLSYISIVINFSSETANSSFIECQRTSQRNILTEKIRRTSTVNAEQVNKNFVEVNKKGNLIPTEYRKVFWTLLGSQEKFDAVLDIFVSKIDELDNQPLKEIEVK